MFCIKVTGPKVKQVYQHRHLTISQSITIENHFFRIYISYTLIEVGSSNDEGIQRRAILSTNTSTQLVRTQNIYLKRKLVFADFKSVFKNFGLEFTNIKYVHFTNYLYLNSSAYDWNYNAGYIFRRLLDEGLWDKWDFGVIQSLLRNKCANLCPPSFKFYFFLSYRTSNRKRSRIRTWTESSELKNFVKIGNEYWCGYTLKNEPAKKSISKEFEL